MLFFLVTCIIIAALFTAHWQQVKTRNQAFGRLAQKFAGHSHDAGFFQRPSAQFTHQGVSTLVDTYSTGGKHPKHYIQLRIYWPQDDLRCEVYPEGFFNRLGKLLGMEDIEIRSPQFDSDYIISGGSPEVLRHLLTPHVQKLIDQLRNWRGNRDIYILWSNGVLLVKKLGRIHRYEELLQFTTLSLQLFDAAMAPRGEGIKFVAPTIMSNEPSVCQICGDEIVREIVYCRSCKTPHHLDCWQYYGACSVYGCGEQRYLQPRRRRRKR